MVNHAERKFPDAVANINVYCNNCGETGLMCRLGKSSLPLFNWLTSYYACGYCGHRNIKVVDASIATDSEQLTTLRTLLGIINGEITRYRDFEWKTITWQIGLSWGLFTVYSYFKDSLSSGLIPFFDSIVAVLIIIGTTLLSANLMFVHGELTTNRNWRRQIERELGVYSKSDIFPKKWKESIVGFSQGRDPFIIPFFLFMWISGLSLAYIIASSHYIPRWVNYLGSIVAIIWQWAIPGIVLLLILLELYYVGYVIIKQGLTSRGPY